MPTKSPITSATTLTTSTSIPTEASESPEPDLQNDTTTAIQINPQQELYIPYGFPLHYTSFSCLKVFENVSVSVGLLFLTDKSKQNMTESTINEFYRQYHKNFEIFCRNWTEYSDCIAEMYRTNDTDIDSILHLYIDRDNADTNFDLHCRNNDTSSNEMKCSIPSMERHCCLNGGIMTIVQYIASVIRTIRSKHRFCDDGYFNAI
jgi:hypothetical protein